MHLAAIKHRLLRLILAYAPWLYVSRARRLRWFVRGKGGLPRKGAQSTGRAWKPCVLVVDHDFPELGRDAGSKAIYHLVGLLQDRAKVVFWSASSMPSVAGADLLRSLGVEVAAKEAGADLDQWLGQRERDGCSFDAMVLSRPIIAAIYMPLARRYIRGITAYYGHDIHHVRLADMKMFESVPGLEAEQREIGRIERRLWKAADVVFYPSDNEVDTVNEYRRRQRLGPNALVLPLWEAPDVPANQYYADNLRGRCPAERKNRNQTSAIDAG